jgi:hypothetical protein
MSRKSPIRRGFDRLFMDVRKILFYEWDPIGVSQYSSCDDEYDSYARTVCRFLLEGADERKIAQYLGEVTRNAIGLQGFSEDHHRQIAKKLCALHQQ